MPPVTLAYLHKQTISTLSTIARGLTNRNPVIQPLAMSAPAHAQLTCESAPPETKVADNTVNRTPNDTANPIRDTTSSEKPASGNNAAQDGDGDRHGGNTADDEATPDVDEDVQKSGDKKKKKKRKSKKKKRKPVTGFEGR